MIVTKMSRPCRGSTALFRPWTVEEETIVRQDYVDLGPAAVAAKIGRTESAVRDRARILKVFRSARRWTPAEDRRLMNALEETSLGWAARRLGRTPRALYDRALRIGLPLGRPPGYESLCAAAARTGFDFKTLEKILRWAKVKIRPSLSQPNARRARTRLQMMVDQFDVDDAVVAWNATETPYAAGRRFGCCDDKIIRALFDSGLELPQKPARGQHWRVPSTIIDEAMRQLRIRLLGSTAQRAAGVFPGANARRDAAAMSISGRRTPSGIDRHRGGILRDTTVTLPKLPIKKHGRIKAEGVTAERDPHRSSEPAARRPGLKGETPGRTLTDRRGIVAAASQQRQTGYWPGPGETSVETLAGSLPVARLDSDDRTKQEAAL